MTYITTGERIGYERGEQEGEQRLILRLLQRRVGEMPEYVHRRAAAYRRNRSFKLFLWNS